MNNIDLKSDVPRTILPSAQNPSADEEIAATVNVKVGPQHSDDLIMRLSRWGTTPEVAARLIYEELCYRQSQGEDISLDDMMQRFPQCRADLEKLRQTCEWAEQVQFPKIGEEVAGYHLVAELGRGGQGQVFLARQIPLAGRPVVLKFTAREGVEHLNLARLQHTYIVPLFGAEDIPERNLRLLSMPFLGAVSLGEMLSRLASRPVRMRTGQDVDEVLQETQKAFADDLPGRGNASEVLRKSAYHTIICRVGFCLAEALDYTHKHGLVHLDIKPSNILLAPDCRPLLLDLHLARTPLKRGEKRLGDFGGTWRYMSPEQRDAVIAAVHAEGIPASVDHRSDIYSLGLVLYDALGGKRNDDEKPVPSQLREMNPHVSPGLMDIVAKCLAPKLEDRYDEASLLAEDLRRHLENRPLRGVPNRSWRESWHKWRRRRPLALPAYCLVLAFLTAIIGAGFAGLSQYQERRLAAEKSLWEGQELLRKQRFEEATGVFERGQEQLGDLPGNALLWQALAQHHRLAEFLHKAQTLHTTVNDLRFNALLDPLPRRSLMVLNAAAGNLWQERSKFREHADLPLEPEVKERILADLQDLVLLRAEMQVRLAPKEQQQAANESALRLFADAEKEFGPQPAILLEQRRIADVLGMKPLTDRLDAALQAHAPQTPWEHVLLGRSYLRVGDNAQAKNEMRQALRLQPLQYLPNFYLGLCSYRQGNFAEAVSAFSFCVGQEPRPEGFYFRGLCLVALNQKDAAQVDFTQAIQRDAYLGSAYFQRGLLLAEKGKWEAACADFEQALAHGADPGTTRCHLAEGHIARKNWVAARTILQVVLQEQPQHEKARFLHQQIPD